MGEGGGEGELALSIDVSLVLILNLYFHKFYYSLRLSKQKTYGKRQPKKKEKKKVTNDLINEVNNHMLLLIWGPLGLWKIVHSPHHFLFDYRTSFMRLGLGQNYMLKWGLLILTMFSLSTRSLKTK